MQVTAATNMPATSTMSLFFIALLFFIFEFEEHVSNLPHIPRTHGYDSILSLQTASDFLDKHGTISSMSRLARDILIDALDEISR